MDSTAHLLIAFAITDLIACLMPGPAVATVTGLALGGSLRGMAGAIMGINAGNGLWYVMVGTGLVALVKRAPEVLAVLGWAGIAYLFWLGIQTWRARAHLETGRAGRQVGVLRGLTTGIAVQLANPKALLFFTVFLPPFLVLSRPVSPQLATLAAIGITLEVLVLMGYGLLAYRLGGLALSPTAERRVARVSGGVFMAVAAGMALARVQA
ncbi:LysE family transporter [Sphingobium sp. DEHP117]|uniref:LysE family translocator n=1 Tax=Sphingobium sp. DEHP117 TaxID=2993436 RepID=UPI0027D7151B|nr:LysE family transporter [Sphingobium sp. DEHP117]MDQ4419653.1 LysE family transporter [Sphingobium sp. DEHP117]